MSKNLMAHESAVASFKMFSQMVLIAFLVSAIIHITVVIIMIVPGIVQLRSVRIPPDGRTISSRTLFSTLPDSEL